MQLSEKCLHFIGGILRHAKGFCAITNPLVNSYKRLVPGYEAPTNIAWSEQNRSPLVRVPAARGDGDTNRAADARSSCNPYLALAVMLRAGLDGIEKEIDPGPPINKNIFTMSHRERRHLRIDELPGNLSEALDELEKDDLVRETLGDHTLRAFRDRQARGVARLHQARLAVGDPTVSGSVLTRELNRGFPVVRRLRERAAPARVCADMETADPSRVSGSGRESGCRPRFSRKSPLRRGHAL